MSYSLLAAVPSHSNTVVVEAAQALILAQEMVLKRGGAFRAHFESGSTISLVRNAIVAAFLQSDADLLLMLDADQAIHPDTLARMIDLDRPVVGCIYPARRFDGGKARAAADPKQLVAQAMSFIGKLITDGSGTAPVEGGFARAEHVGTGILLLRREAIERLMDHYPELEGRGFGEDAYPQYNGGGRWGFFNPIDNDAGVPLSEDLSFCRRWRAAGGEIWADVTSTTLHVGRHTFIGSLAEQPDALSAAGATRQP